MNFDQIKELISLIDSSTVAYFEIENEDEYIRIDKSMSRSYVANEAAEPKKAAQPIVEASKETATESKAVEAKAAVEPVAQEVVEESGDFEYITSPIVGTFYSKSSPQAEPFVAKGDRVSQGDIVCIVEAMKLMNEITAEFDCEIVEVVCEDSKMVEYGQKLFKVKRV